MTARSIFAVLILPSAIKNSNVKRATSLRIGLNPDIRIASGVSSTISSTPVAASKERIFLPSLPIILPFISSLGNETVDTAVSTTWSPEQRSIA